ETSPLSLHDALPISPGRSSTRSRCGRTRRRRGGAARPDQGRGAADARRSGRAPDTRRLAAGRADRLDGQGTSRGEPVTRQAIRRALISVYDKTGLEALGRGLAEAGVEIVSTGSTASRLADAGVPVTPVEQVTGFPECLEGRVKTLHPKVHAGLLADRRKEDHRAALAELGVDPFDLVVVNLYPF